MIFFYVQKIKIWFLFPVKKYIAVGEMIVFCVLFCRSPLNDMNACLGRVHAASYNTNRIGGVMVRVLASSAVDPKTI
jgi:hypothetical protein